MAPLGHVFSAFPNRWAAERFNSPQPQRQARQYDEITNPAKIPEARTCAVKTSLVVFDRELGVRRLS